MAMGEQHQFRSRSWNRMPTKRCSANGIMNEFIILDDDEVIILDESSKGKAPETSRTRNEQTVLQRVISLDDDDDDDVDDTENVHKAGSSSNRNSNAVNSKTSEEVVDDDDDDDCQFVQEKCASFRFSKCNQDFPTVPSYGTRFGLDSESDSDFSESDCSDCEILDGSNGEIRVQWEKAFLQKMKKAGKDGLSKEAGTSNLHCDTDFRTGFESRTEQHDQTSSFFAAKNTYSGKETSSAFFATEKSGKAGWREEASPSSLHCDTDFRHSFGSRTEQHDQTSSFFNARNANNGHERSNTPTNDATSSKEEMNQNSFKEVEQQPDTVQVRCETSQWPKESQKKKAAEHSHTKEVVQEEEASKSSPPHTYDGNGETPPVLDISNGARCRHGGESTEPIIDPIPSTSGQVEGLQGTAHAMDVMLNREMLKETDEYKKAQEEEWESRQRQLQLQAEEAQKQRKRRKLANMRQLEMERRQKERVEEVRETQKKDEESMSMKEKVRAKITKSLKILELKSINMASLLRGLGIPVGGGLSPLPQEVHAAYKRAVLKFHPDRASRGDIKQQVEAEEKFKLISRMKDKFLS